MTRLTAKEATWLATEQPGLMQFKRPTCTVIEGRFRFHLTHKSVTIKDTYDIRLELPHDGKRPRVKETGGRIKAVYATHPEFKSPADIHAFDNWNLCLAAPQEITLVYLSNPNIKLFFERYLAPFFYSQSFFEKNRDWPWPHLRHNTNGIVDWFVDNQNVSGAIGETVRELVKLAKDGRSLAMTLVENAMKHDSFNPRGRCLCGGKRNYIQCHPGLHKLALPLRRASQPDLKSTPSVP